MKPYLIPWLLALTLAGCKKNEVDALPKATQEGKGTMGCLVNGKAWKPYGAPQFGSANPYAVYWRLRDNRRQVSLTLFFTRQADDRPSSMDFYVPNVSGLGTITLDQPADPIITSANPAYAYYSISNIYPNPAYLTGPTATGNLTLTRFDTVARVVSGNFAFTGRAADGTTVQVTDGRFDMCLERR